MALDEPRLPPVVVGVGNRDRGDDGVGPAVADELRRRSAPCTTIVREGDLSDLLLLWSGDDDVIVVDACAAGEPVGTVTALDIADIELRSAWSSHGLGVADALVLAQRLGRLPRRLRLVGIEGRSFGFGPLSAELAAALAGAVDEIEAMLAPTR